MDGWNTIREIVDRRLHDGNSIKECITDCATKPLNPLELIGTIKGLAEVRKG